MQQTAAGALGAGVQKKGFFSSFYTKGEEIFNAVSHIAGALFGLIAWGVTLFFAYPDPSAMAAVSVFGASIVILYTMSALYHALPDGRAILMTVYLAAITPACTTITSMAQLYGQDASRSSALYVLSTLLSILTMPLMLGLFSALL